MSVRLLPPLWSMGLSLAVVPETCRKTVGFCGHHVQITGYGQQAPWLIDFLCGDLLVTEQPVVRARYDLMMSSELSLWLKGKCLYSGSSPYDLAYHLINEIIHQCIVDNNSGHAIHAAAITTKAGSVLLPGRSGSGKTTLCTWLVAKGCGYLSDELVLLGDGAAELYPFTRPLSIKRGAQAALSSIVDFNSQDVLRGDNGFMVPHRFLHHHGCAKVPSLALILFPKYREHASTELLPLSPGLGCAHLLESYVNARNLEGHGVSGLASITRTTPVYQLTYGSFEDLPKIMSQALPAVFGQLSQ